MGELSYFVGKVLDRVSDVFLPCCPQVLSRLNWGCRVFLKHTKVQFKRENFMGIFLMLLALFLKLL